MNTPTTQDKQNSGFFSNLAFNIVIPVLIMSYASKEEYLGPAWSVVVALAFPFGFGIWELIKSRKVNYLSILGIVSVLLTGGFSLLKLPAEYFAIKEAAIPAIIGLIVLGSQFTSKPLVKMILLNDKIVNWPKLELALDTEDKKNALENKVAHSSYIVVFSFFLSSTLNYILAKMILVSQPGTSEYTEELARMTALSYPVIAVPSMVLLLSALFYTFYQISKITGKSWEEFLNQ